MAIENKKDMNNGKLGLFALITMCMGSMVGSGLFDLPQNVSCTTGIFAAFIGWLITCIGMLSLVKVFQNLSERCPHLDTGVYSYAKEGLGEYLGFSSAWGYWFSAWIANVGYSIIFCSALSMFFPAFGDGTNMISLIFNSIIIWSITILCMKGTKSATVINTITTISKILPIAIFITLLFFNFKLNIFTKDIWQVTALGSVLDQVKHMMLVTVWVFIGIEGANVLSSRAKNRSDVSKATFISFLIVFFILFAISMLPFGILDPQILSNLKKPSTSSLLTLVIGGSGGVFMNIALIISVLGAFLAWTLLAAEVPFIASKKDNLFPAFFAKENKSGAPIGTLIVTALCQQTYLFIVLFYKSGYLATIMLATSMILLPYLFSSIYAMILSISDKLNNISNKNSDNYITFINCLAVIYCIWLIYAAGVKYLLLSSVLYMIGSIVFIFNKLQRKQKIFNRKHELISCTILSILGIICLLCLITGKITV